MHRPFAGSRLPLWATVLANLVPLVGVLGFGWRLFGVFLVYVAETAILGAVTVVRILSARSGEGGRVGVAAFFVFHYGLFWTGHVLFVATTFGDGLPLPDLRLAVGSMLASHALALASWLRSAAPREAVPTLEMFRPYPRVAVLHLAILGGGVLVASSASQLVGLALLVGLKTAVDAVAAWWRGGAARPPPPGSVVRIARREARGQSKSEQLMK